MRVLDIPDDLGFECIEPGEPFLVTDFFKETYPYSAPVDFLRKLEQMHLQQAFQGTYRRPNTQVRNTPDH